MHESDCAPLGLPCPVPPDAPSRRTFLQLGLGGLGCIPWLWSNWLEAADTQSSRAGRAKSVILIFNCGGPSHIDLWDPKPHAPDAARGPFKPIQTSVPGMLVSELLPHVAQHADKLAIVRTVHHEHRGGHNAAMYWSITGRPYRVDQTTISPSRTDYPSFGTLVGWLARRDGYASPLPPYVITPTATNDTRAYITPGQLGGCLGPRYDPFIVDRDTGARNFQVPGLLSAGDVSLPRLEHRKELLTNFTGKSRFHDALAVREFELNQASALQLSSSQAGHAFDLSEEDAKTRERYGRHTWGQSHLLARRLVEAGVRFVTTVNGTNRGSYAGSIAWDTHKDNFNRLSKELAPPMDQALGALLADLDERGLLETTLVVSMGDFGRSPLINKEAGREHWPACYSMVLAGGGIRGGQVIGESDRIGASPRERPVTPADIHATVFRAIGYDPSAITYPNADGRPMLLSEGTPIAELL